VKTVVNKSSPGYEMFHKAGFLRWLGVELITLSDGICEARLPIRDEFLQQDGFVHAGIITTLADHCAGGAVGCKLNADQKVLSIEFKTNFLRAAKSKELFCRSTPLKVGRTIAVAESSIYSTLAEMHAEMQKGDVDALIAKSTVTLAVLSV